MGRKGRQVGLLDKGNGACLNLNAELSGLPISNKRASKIMIVWYACHFPRQGNVSSAQFCGFGQESIVTKMRQHLKAVAPPKVGAQKVQTICIAAQRCSCIQMKLIRANLQGERLSRVQ